MMLKSSRSLLVICRLHSAMLPRGDGCNGPVPEGHVFSTHLHPGHYAGADYCRAQRGDVFDEGKARRDAINGFENVWTNWMELAATIDWAVQGCVKNSPLWKSVDVVNATKNNRGVRQYPLVHLLQLDVLPVYELIIKSAICRQQYGRLPYVALAFLGRQASNAASEGGHSTGQLVMSDKQTKMSSDTLEKVVCLRNSRSAIKVLKEIYVDEAKNVAHDITERLSKVRLYTRLADEYNPSPHSH